VDVPRFDERAADQLRAGLDDAVNRLAADVLKNQRGPVGLRADEPEEPDVLDELIAAASRNEEVRP
jgi:GT2 family glycosyltransferase